MPFYTIRTTSEVDFRSLSVNISIYFGKYADKYSLSQIGNFPGFSTHTSQRNGELPGIELSIAYKYKSTIYQISQETKTQNSQEMI